MTGTITLGEWQLLRSARLGQPVDPTELFRLEHLGLVDIADDGSIELTDEGLLTLDPRVKL